MFYKLGRLLQVVGLLLLPAAVAGEVAQRLDEKQELLLAGAGIVIFYVGWRLQRAAGTP
jgi:hypothetical protein